MNSSRVAVQFCTEFRTLVRGRWLFAWVTELKKFFFDDVRDSPGADWIVARNVSEARHVLVRRAFDVMSLDHDIGMRMMCERCHDEIPKPITQSQLEEKLKLGCVHMEHGTDLAKWMVRNLASWPKLIIIHSANPYGAKRMKSILGRYAEVKIIDYDRCRYDRIVDTAFAYWIVACCGLAGGIVGIVLAWAR
jgi:hypothetical protein